MGTITDKLTYLQDTKNAIKDAIVNKGVSVSDSDTFRSYADKISSITTGEGGGSSDEWQPQSDWWDIEKILEEDTEEYPAKIIILLLDTGISTGFHGWNADKILMSDGTVYNNQTWFTHTWDRTKDKKTSKGYNTRYAIYYFTNTEKTINNTILVSSTSDMLYLIFKGFTALNANNFMNGNRNVQAVKFIDTVYTGSSISGWNCSGLETFIGMNAPNLTAIGFQNGYRFRNINSINYQNLQDISNMFNMNQTIKYLDFPDDFPFANITNYYGCFNSSGIININRLDFNSAITITNMFNTNTSLTNINEIVNIKISGINLTQAIALNHDTLVRFINALYDYASEGSTSTYTLTLGTTNLAKLTDEEKAIATNKGWTLA